MDEKKKIIMTKRGLAAVLIIVFILGGAGGMLGMGIYTFFGMGDNVIVAEKDFETIYGIYEKYAKLETLNNELNLKYYKELNQEDLMTGMYKGLFEATGDPYTQYLTPKEYEAIIAGATGNFYGIGVTMTATVDDRIIVISTIEGSPAEAAGIKTGDIITKVDGTAYSGSQLSDAAFAMRGERNTKVKVTYLSGEEIKEVTLTRKEITTKSVYSDDLGDDIGYIRITSFEMETAADFEKELRSMEMKGVKGIVIDIRNNGGGVVDSGIAIADMLLPEGNIVYLEDRQGERVYYNSDSKACSVPYVLLVNGGTASTSEILAGAVKDNKGGKLVGEATFGKGVIQAIEGLKDGSGVRITIQQYFSPDGNAIHDVGIKPDYSVVLGPEDTEDLQLLKAIELLK